MKKYIIKEVRTKKKKLQNKTLHFYIPIELYAQFKEMCNLKNKVMNSVIRDLLATYIEVKK